MSNFVIVDYGMGNLRSAQKAFEKCGCGAVLSRDSGKVSAADALVVPGVGSFGDCVDNLERYGLMDAIRGFLLSGKPYLGICLGLHILFTSSEEAEGRGGLDIFPGRVKRFRGEMKIPHMGWNTIEMGRGTARGAGKNPAVKGARAAPCPLFEGVKDGAYVYFVHSYYAAPEDDSIVSARTEYGGGFASAVYSGNIMATQFHPEKSQRVGLAMISNFIDFAGGAR